MVMCHAVVIQTAKLPACLEVISGAIIHSISGGVTGSALAMTLAMTLTAMTMTISGI